VSIIITCRANASKRAHPFTSRAFPVFTCCRPLLLTWRSSPAAIRDRPPPPPSRSHLGELDLELSNNRAPTSRPPLRHKHKPPTPTQDCLHPIPHSRCHISQANQISISVKSPCRIERNPIAAEVYHQETRDWIEAKGSARLGFAKTKAAPQHLADHTS
jgi:hypothetical protein